MRKNYVIKKCLICGNELKVCPARIKDGKGKFCSRECYWESLKGKLKAEIKSGQKFGRLTAIKFIKMGKNHHQCWLFRCDCGNEKIIMINSVKTGNTKSCGCLNKENLFKVGNISWSKGKKRPEMTGENNHNWKGDSAGYIALHNWVYRQKGKPKICEHCGATCKERKLSWANVDHKYRRVLDDYISLCYSCHKKYDLKYNRK